MNKFLGTAIVTAAVVALDLGTKVLAEAQLTEVIDVLPFLRLELTHNPALAFGLPMPQLVIVLLSIAVLGWLGWLLQTKTVASWQTVVTFGLVLGGAIGNLWERAMHGEVTDFISFLMIPNFNLADAALTIGVLFLIYYQRRIFLSAFFA